MNDGKSVPSHVLNLMHRITGPCPRDVRHEDFTAWVAEITGEIWREAWAAGYAFREAVTPSRFMVVTPEQLAKIEASAVPMSESGVVLDTTGDVLPGQ